MLSPKIFMASRLPIANFFLYVFLQLIGYMFFTQTMGYYIEPGNYFAGRQSLNVLLGLILVFFILFLARKENSRWDLGMGVIMLWLMGSFFLWTLINGAAASGDEPSYSAFLGKRVLLAGAAAICYLAGLMIVIEEIRTKLGIKDKRETY